MREITFKNAIREALIDEMHRDKTVYMMGEDIGAYGGACGVTKGLIDIFGAERIMDTPISEGGFTGCAVGSAITGMRPIMEIMFADFITVCFDQIVNQGAKMHYMFGGQINVPMVLRAPSGGGTGAGAQHSQSPESMLCGVSGLKVIMPSTPYDAKGLLKSAIRDNNPVIFFEPRTLYDTKGIVPTNDYTIPIGIGDVKKEGTDISLITYGRMVPICLSVAIALKGDISVEVFDLRTLSPLDKNGIIRSANKTKRCIVVHEAQEFGGFGGEICATIAEHTNARVARVCGANVPSPVAKVLENMVCPSCDKIIDKIKEMCGR